MDEGTTRTAAWRRRATLAGVVATLAIAGLGAASPAKALTPNDAEYRATRAPVTVTACNGSQITVETRERDELNLHNARRREVGVPQICIDPALQKAAEAHAKDMIERGYLSHTSPEGKTPAQRAAEAGYGGQGVGENLAGTPPESTATDVLQMWMNSAGHRYNLERAQYVHVGMASADSAPVDDDPNDQYPAWITSSVHVALFGSGSPTAAPAPAPAPTPPPADQEVPEEPSPPAPPAPVPAMPQVTNLKPAQGSVTRDRTPLASAVVCAAGREIVARQVKVYVDGRLVKASYSAATDRMRAQLPGLRPGKHTVKVTVAGGPSLKVASTRFAVK